MRRILLTLVIGLCAPLVMAQTTTTYTGTIKDLTGAVVTSGRITFTLNAPSGATIPGVGSFVATTVSCLINSSGQPVASDGTSPCVITDNSALTPTGTSYTVCRQPYYTTPGSCFVTYANGGTVDISTIVPTPATQPSYGVASAADVTANAAAAAAAQTAANAAQATANAALPANGCSTTSGGNLSCTTLAVTKASAEGVDVLESAQRIKNGYDATSPRLLIDTDFQSDADDVGALMLALHFVDSGQAQILAVLHDVNLNAAAYAIQATLAFAGHPNVPVGELSDSTPTKADTYATLISNAFPSIGMLSGQVQDAVTLARSTLASQPDGSVTYVSIGTLRVLYDLYNSPADSISPLTGKQLVANKIKKFVIMAGDYPSGSSESNIATDATAATVINQIGSDLPNMEVDYVGYTLGNSVTTDATTAPTNSPVYVAYNAMGGSRPSWDPLTMLYAIVGNSTYFTQSAAGKNSVSGTANTFTTGSGAQHYLSLAGTTTTAAMGTLISGYVTGSAIEPQAQMPIIRANGVGMTIQRLTGTSYPWSFNDSSIGIFSIYNKTTSNDAFMVSQSDQIFNWSPSSVAALNEVSGGANAALILSTTETSPTTAKTTVNFYYGAPSGGPLVGGWGPGTLAWSSGMYLDADYSITDKIANQRRLQIAPSGGAVTVFGSGIVFQIQRNSGTAFPWSLNDSSAGTFSIYNGATAADIFKLDQSGNVTVPSLASTTGTRYLCADTSGKIVSQATACSGT